MGPSAHRTRRRARLGRRSCERRTEALHGIIGGKARVLSRSRNPRWSKLVSAPPLKREASVSLPRHPEAAASRHAQPVTPTGDLNATWDRPRRPVVFRGSVARSASPESHSPVPSASRSPTPPQKKQRPPKAKKEKRSRSRRRRRAQVSTEDSQDALDREARRQEEETDRVRREVALQVQRIHSLMDNVLVHPVHILTDVQVLEMLRRTMLTVQARQLQWQGYTAGVRNQRDFP